MDVNLEAPLDPALEYYDATPSIEVLAKKIEELGAMLANQTGINSKLLLIAKDLQARVNQLESRRNGLILPERLDS